MSKNETLDDLLNEAPGFEKLIFVANEPTEMVLVDAKEKLDEASNSIAFNFKLEVTSGEYKGKSHYIYTPIMMNFRDTDREPILHPTFTALVRACLNDQIKKVKISPTATRAEKFDIIIKTMFENVDELIGRTLEVKFKKFREYQGKKYQDVAEIKDLGILEASTGDSKEVSF